MLAGESQQGPDEYLDGSILFIRLKDFVTYDYCEFAPGPRLNMLLGPNGSGKSSIVSAVAIGLGFPTSILGRASNISQFVKFGKERAMVEIHLKARPRGTSVDEHGRLLPNAPVRRVRRVFGAKSNLSEWFLDGQRCTKEVIDTLVRGLNIQLGNLCQCLPQDKVSEFAKLSPVELLAATQGAASEPETLEQQRELIRLRASEKQLVRELDEQDAHLRQLESLNESLSEQVTKFHEQARLYVKIGLIKSKRPWLEYNMARDRFLASKEKREQLRSSLEAAMQATAPVKERIDGLELALKRATKSLSSSVGQVNDRVSRLSNEKDQLASTARQSKDALRSLSSLLEREKNVKQAILELQSDITRIDQKMKTPPQPAGVSSIESELGQVQAERGALEAEIDKLSLRRGEIENEGRMHQRRINELNERLSLLENVKNERLKMLRSFDPDTYAAYEWFQQNRGQFRGQAHEPILLDIHVKKPEYAAVVENSLSRQAMASFVFSDDGDWDHFLRNVSDHRGLRVNAICQRHALDRYRNPLGSDRLRELGFECYLNEVVQAPDLVVAALCESFRIHTNPVSLQRLDYRRVDGCLEITKYFADSQVFEIKRSARGELVSVSSRPLKPPRLLVQSTNPSLVRSLQGTIQESRGALLSNERSTKELVIQEQRLRSSLERVNGSWRELSGRKRTALLELDQFRNLARMRDLKVRELGQLSSDASFREREQELRRGLLGSFLAVAGAAEKLGEASTAVRVAVEEHRGLSAEVRDLEAGLAAAKTEFRQFEDSLEDLRSGLVAAEEALRQDRLKAKELLEKAKKNPLTEDTKTRFAELPGTLAELDDLLASEEALANVSTSISSRVVDEYEKRQVEIAGLKKRVESMLEAKSSLARDMCALRSEWEPRVSGLVAAINENFSAYFKHINSVGEVHLERVGNDFDMWGIHIFVRFREGERLHLLDSERQSGGERSLSTILYLLALQQMSRYPFRVVDEINQGMDPKNERLVHNLMVRFASQDQASQYFLITPKLLFGLEYSEHMRVHFVHNGDWVPSHSEWKTASVA